MVDNRCLGPLGSEKVNTDSPQLRAITILNTTQIDKPVP